MRSVFKGRGGGGSWKSKERRSFGDGDLKTMKNLGDDDSIIMERGRQREQSAGTPLLP